MSASVRTAVTVYSPATVGVQFVVLQLVPPEVMVSIVVPFTCTATLCIPALAKAEPLTVTTSAVAMTLLSAGVSMVTDPSAELVVVVQLLYWSQAVRLLPTTGVVCTLADKVCNFCVSVEMVVNQ